MVHESVTSPAQSESVREDLLVQVLHHTGIGLQFFKVIVRNLRKEEET